MRPRTIAHGSSIYSSVVKMAGEEREPHPEDHPSSPEQKLRPRAEVILYTEDGVWGIKNPKYLLLPGGGIPEGQRPDEAAIVEALEEADRLCHNLEERSIVSTIYDKKYMSYKDWDGEVTHFFIALDGGPGGMNHKDREKFTVIPFEDAMSYLSDMMNKSENEWAHENNQTRMRIIQEAQRRAKMEDNGLIPTKYAYWREDLPRYLKRTGTYKALATYIESLSGKNIVRAMNSEAAIAAKKEQVKRLYNKELNKAFATKSGPKITKLQGRAAGERRKGFMGAIDQIFKTSPDKAGAKAQQVAEQSGAVNKERLRKLEDMKAKLTVARPTSVVGEQMRTNDARFLTATGLIGGGIVGGNYLVNKSKAKPFTSDGPAYMMPPGYREPISVMNGIPPMPEIKQASYRGENNMDNELLQKIAEEALSFGYNDEMDKLAVTAPPTAEEAANMSRFYKNNVDALTKQVATQPNPANFELLDEYGNVLSQERGLTVASRKNTLNKYKPNKTITDVPYEIIEKAKKKPYSRKAMIATPTYSRGILSYMKKHPVASSVGAAGAAAIGTAGLMSIIDNKDK